MCVMSPNCKAQIGAYDNGIQLPITDIYETKTLAVLVVDIDSPNKECFINDIPNRLGNIARVITSIIRKDY